MSNMNMMTSPTTPTPAATPQAPAPLKGVTPVGPVPTVVLPVFRGVAIQTMNSDDLGSGPGFDAAVKQAADQLVYLLLNHSSWKLWDAVKAAIEEYQRTGNGPSLKLPIVTHAAPKGPGIPDGLVGILERAKEQAESAESNSNEAESSAQSALDASLSDAVGYIESAQFEAGSASSDAQGAVESLDEALVMIEEAPTTSQADALEPVAEALRSIVDALDPFAERTTADHQQTLAEARSNAQQALETVEAL